MFASFDYLFPCKLSLPWFLCLGILDCIIRLRILIKSYGESWYFCFSRESTQLGSGYKFLFVFCELWFPWVPCSKTLRCSLHRLVWMPPSGRSVTWEEICLINYLLVKVHGMLFSMRSMCVQRGGDPKSTYTALWFCFAKLFLLCNSWYFFLAL